jgi:hypothetical protein
MKIKAYFLFFLIGNSFLFSAIFSEVHIVNLPQESNIVDISKIDGMKRDLDDLFNGEEERIEYLTPKEARHYFSDYVREKYGLRESIRLINQFFNKKYFGEPVKEVEEKTSQQIAKEDPYLFSHISNALKSKDNAPGHERTMENAKKRWNIETLFLTPKEVFEALPNYIILPIKTAKGTSDEYEKDLFEDLYKTNTESFEEFKKKYPEKAEAIFSTKFFIPVEPLARENYLLHNSLGFFDQELVEDIYTVAKKIMAATKPGDYIVIFGNTPYFVGRALQKLSSKNPDDDDYRVVIEFPFSGSPNRMRAFNPHDKRDIVTKERLGHLQKRLRAVGLSPENKDLENHSIYFVDVIASGGGISYVVEEILKSFIAEDSFIPDINVIVLNNIDIENPADNRNALIADKNAQDGEHVTLFFPSKDKTHFTVDAQVIYLPRHGALDMLPSKEWRIFPEYNAAYWQPNYDYLLKLPEKKFTKILLDFFDSNLKNIMKKKSEKEKEK